MSNYILKYSRGEQVKYISHLDFIRLFHRAVHRAGLEMSFSQGFNPHPVMTVALPLSVGVTADGEYMKIGFEKDYDESFVIEKLNEAMPLGFIFKAAKRLVVKEIDLTKIDRAKYRVCIETDCDIDIDNFMCRSEIKIMKKSKSGVKETDIRPLIYSMEKKSCENGCLEVEMCLAAGSVNNLKPDAVVDAFEKYILGFEQTFYTVHRLGMYENDRDFL